MKKNENSSEPKVYPRIVYPNDILPDENPYSEMSREAIHEEVKADSSNPR